MLRSARAGWWFPGSILTDTPALMNITNKNFLLWKKSILLVLPFPEPGDVYPLCLSQVSGTV